MQLIGKAIQHNVLGRGIVTGWNETKITICFPEGEKHFIYPDAFTNFLTLKDKTAQKQINKLLDEHRALKGGNPKFCVTAKSGANRVKFIMGGRRVKRLPPCLQHNASGTGCQGGAIISPQPSI